MRRFIVAPFVLCLIAPAPAAADDRSVCDAGKGDAAIAACGRILASGPERGRARAVVYRNRCAAFNDKRDSERALADCNRAISIDSGYAAAYVERGYAWRYKRDFDRAVGDFSQAIRLEPRSAAGHAGRCVALANKRDFDHAITDCNEALRLDPRNAT